MQLRAAQVYARDDVDSIANRYGRALTQGLTVADVQALVACSRQPPVVVIAPDRHGKGTNALLVSPAGGIHYSFGKESFQRHCGLAGKAGIRLEVCDRPNLALDLDLPADLEMVNGALEQLQAYNSRHLKILET